MINEYSLFYFFFAFQFKRISIFSFYCIEKVLAEYKIVILRFFQEYKLLVNMKINENRGIIQTKNILMYFVIISVLEITN